MTRKGHGVGRRLTLLLAVLGLALTALTVVAGAGAANAGSAAAATDKVKPALAEQLAAKGEASFWVRFQQADLSSAASIKDWDKRGQAVYDALQAAAEQTQGSTRTVLDEAGVGYRTFWATNAIRVTAGDTALVEKIAQDEAVKGLYATFDYDLEKPAPGKDLKAVDSVEWGVANINADDVWNEFGATGEGITVASIDSGVDYDHPALVGHYRGNNGDGTFTHDYNFFDAAGACPDDAPCDTDGHGTHTMGTMVGDDGGANQIGVAPGAKWIAADGCCPSDEALIASGEWMLAPTDSAGDNPDVTKRPNVINNSWGTQVPSNDPFMEDVEAGLGGLRDLGPVVQRQQRPGMCDQRVPRQPDHQLLGRCLRHQQRHRQLLLAWHRPGRRDQAEHLRPRRQRALQPSRRLVRLPQRYVDGLAARGRRGGPALVRRPVADR